MARQLIAAGNWKMNTNHMLGMELAENIHEGLNDPKGLVILAPPHTSLQTIGELISGSDEIKLAAQNCHDQENGAYTGEVSINMLIPLGVEYVILGHSERRAYNHESNDLLASKTDLVLSKGLKPIFCCGESLDIREAGDHIAYVANQLKESLFHLSAEEFNEVIIAYEPIWAIGTGVTASPDQAQEMHQNIRQLIADQYSTELADSTSILYGGSVKPANAEELFSKPDVDGGLVGGASLKAEDFLAIIHAF